MGATSRRIVVDCAYWSHPDSIKYFAGNRSTGFAASAAHRRRPLHVIVSMPTHNARQALFRTASSGEVRKSG